MLHLSPENRIIDKEVAFFMNKYKQHLLNEKILKELHILGMHVVEPCPEHRTKKIKPGLIMSLDNDNCELLELSEISEFRELWKVRLIDSGDIEYKFI